jgi:alkylation response protein AidB-like acyl-CoA dehydrogenase
VRYGVAQQHEWNTLTDKDFRALIRADFEAHYPEARRYPSRRLLWNEQSEWYLRMAAKGWIAPNWPVEYGGMGLAPAKLLIFLEEQDRWGISRFQDHGVRMIGPVLQRYGTDERAGHSCYADLDCSHRYCQGYSEPEAGSDLASLRTTAVRDGDAIVNGTEDLDDPRLHRRDPHVSARPDYGDTGPKQAQISFFLLDLDSAGVTVRRIQVYGRRAKRVRSSSTCTSRRAT